MQKPQNNIMSSGLRRDNLTNNVSKTAKEKTSTINLTVRENELNQLEEQRQENKKDDRD